MPKLICQTGPKAGHEYPLTKDLVIMGRQSVSDVQVIDHMCSRSHCQLRRDGRMWTLVDLGSRNGTMLNGKRMAGERQMVFGDRLRIGEAEYQFVKESGDVELKDLLTKYEIQEKIGEGGMGIVFKASQRSMARVVALKVLSPKYASKPRFVEQFIREARAAGALNHPNLIQVHDVGTENDIHYFSMEYVDGPTCMQVLKAQGAFPVDEALEIIRQAALALEYAHGQHLIHQDIKPDNIMLGANNLVKLADLGISKTFAEAEADGHPQKVMGTPHYMAPEAALGKRIDHRVDLYSLGATLYHLLAGKPPFAGTHATDVLKAHVSEPLPPLQDLNPKVSDEVLALVERLLAKKPDDRYQTATAVIDEIKRLLAGKALGTERIAGSETMILRRYAVGANGAQGPGTPAATTGDRTTGASTFAPEPEHHAIRRIVTWTVVAVATTVVVIAGLRMMPKEKPVDTGTVARPATGAAPANTGPTVATVTEDELAARLRRETAQNAVRKVEADLQKNGEANVVAAQTELERIAGDDTLDAATRAQATQVMALVTEIQGRRRQQQVAQAYADLAKEVQTMRDEKNWDVALKRLEAFPERNNDALRAKFDQLRADVDKERTTWTEGLATKVAALVKGKDLSGLRRLRDQLPKTQLDGVAAKSIDAAITQIDVERMAIFQAAAERMAKALAAWKLDAVTSEHETSRQGAGATPVGAQMDEYQAAAVALPKLVEALSDRIRTLRSVRYKGVLKGSPNADPDLIAISLADGLQGKDATGGSFFIRWNTLTAVDVRTVAEQVLGKDACKPYDAALTTLGAARGDK